ncbi:hypothetical protein BV22DRAFT_1134936 [Leucogyrophana mollusca]|uniref:Uncharacterized protein n=1 Tax=Leucogyrophana mollusca TaxID=85980 RepID=A0ACB8AWU7_9AGAM|nr:hypothetical protein BV22DRAFT_1134936 [Leucogyrophana mollusca]
MSADQYDLFITGLSAMTGQTTRKGVGGHKQRQATERWLAKPGVRQAQLEKARLRSARNRELKRAAGLTISDGHRTSRGRAVSASSEMAYSASDVNDAAFLASVPKTPLNEEPSLTFPPPCFQSDDLPSLPTLAALRVQVNEWQVKWGSETAWGKRFDAALQRSREGGWRATDEFYNGCEQHALRGRAILARIREILQTLSRGAREDIADQLLQVYDISTLVLSEVRFFEVKLDSLCACCIEE